MSLRTYSLLLSLLAVTKESLSLECGQFDSHQGATFDLRQLTRQAGQPSYVVEDGDIPCTTIVEQNYTYYFNICGTVPSFPVACTTLSGLNSAGALQVDQRATADPVDDWCYNAGAFDMSTTLALIDPDSPTKGVKLTYYGDYCANHKQRMFNIELSCADKLNPIPDSALENSHCVYTVTMPSIYGCPLECPVGGSERRLCGGQGYCAYDTDASSARCFCNHGYGGPDCATPASSSEPTKNYSPAMLGLTITIFIIIAVLGVSVYLMIRQMSAYKDDLANYQVLKGGDEESTTV